eukprot:9343694-Lingulodinium_polyedra.AAC.1
MSRVRPSCVRCIWPPTLAPVYSALRLVLTAAHGCWARRRPHAFYPVPCLLSWVSASSPLPCFSGLWTGGRTALLRSA